MHPTPRLADEQLARLAAAGNRAAFDELMRRHASGLRILLRRMGAERTLADDLAQDACLKAFERIGAFRAEGPFAAWLHRIAARMYVRRWRSERRFEMNAELLDDLHVAAVPRVSLAEGIDLDRALEALSATERLCVTLCIGVGLTHEEAAEELRMPLGTVKSHVHRGLVKLRKVFEHDVERARRTHRARA